ncbi:MAG: HPF/RaiA family ribosome-associated protein [bacterium]|nr:HPF/RaiA family ribosome-associated protein [bacterium]
MDFHIKFTNLEPDERIKNLVQKKIGSLDKFLDKAETERPGLGPLSVHAWIELAKTTEHHKEGRIWYAECDIIMPGKRHFRATSTNYDLEAAIDEVKEELERILRNSKEKRRNNLRKS